MSDIPDAPDPFDLLQALPEALVPHFAKSQPNERIPIYNGPLNLSLAGKTIRTDAIITLRSLSW
jgi:hypothetical protein